MVNSLITIVEQTLLYLPLIYGGYLSISLMKQPDLSINSAYLVGAICGAKIGMPFGLLASCLGGLVVGLTTSTLARYGHIPYLLAAIISTGIFHGISLFLLGSASISLGQEITEKASMIVNVFVPIILILLYLFLKTKLGHSLAVYGDNPKFFAHHRINTTFVLLSGIGIANLLAGLAGYLFTLSNGFVEITMGTEVMLLCITSIVLGKTFCFKHRPINYFVPLIGTFSYFALQQILLKVGFNLKYFTLVQSLIILIAVVYFFRQRAKAGGQPLENLGV